LRHVAENTFKGIELEWHAKNIPTWAESTLRNIKQFLEQGSVQHTNLWNWDLIGVFQFQTSPTDSSQAQIYSVWVNKIPFYN